MLTLTERGHAGLNWPSGTPFCLATQSNMVPKWDKCRIMTFFVALRHGHVWFGFHVTVFWTQWMQQHLLWRNIVTVPLSGDRCCGGSPLPNWVYCRETQIKWITAYPREKLMNAIYVKKYISLWDLKTVLDFKIAFLLKVEELLSIHIFQMWKCKAIFQTKRHLDCDS